MFSLHSMSEILQPFTFFTRSKGTFLCTGDTLSKRETLQMWSFLVFSIEEIQWNPNRHPRESSYWRLYCVVSFLLEWIEESDLLNLISASWKISSIVYMMRILLHRWKIKCFKLQLIITKAHTCFFKKKLLYWICVRMCSSITIPITSRGKRTCCIFGHDRHPWKRRTNKEMKKNGHCLTEDRDFRWPFCA